LTSSPATRIGYWLLQASIAAACVLGLWAPWDRYFAERATTLTWLYTPALLARHLNISFASATVAVTVALICLVTAGALLKLAARAAAIPFDGPEWSKHPAQTTISDRGSRDSRLRTTTSVGTMLVSLGAAILMPPSGAAFFLIFLFLVQLFVYFKGKKSANFTDKLSAVVLEAHKKESHENEPYKNPGVVSPSHASTAAAFSRWASAALRESFAVTYAICLVIFAWRYNPDLLLRCLLICLGLSLVMRALLPADWRQTSQADSLDRQLKPNADRHG
jgi:hypothetical protein